MSLTYDVCFISIRLGPRWKTVNVIFFLFFSLDALLLIHFVYSYCYGSCSHPSSLQYGHSERSTGSKIMGLVYEPSRRSSRPNVRLKFLSIQMIIATHPTILVSRLLGSPDSQTLLTTLIFILNCINGSKTRM